MKYIAVALLIALAGCSGALRPLRVEPIALTFARELQFDAEHHSFTLFPMIRMTNDTGNLLPIDMTSVGATNIRVLAELVDRRGFKQLKIPEPVTIGSRIGFGRRLLKPGESFSFERSLSFSVPTRGGAFQLSCQIEVVEVPESVDAAGNVRVFDQPLWPVHRFTAEPVTIRIESKHLTRRCVVSHYWRDKTDPACKIVGWVDQSRA